MAKKFEQVKRGYDPETVDIYISELEEQLRDYRDKESAITSAIVNAQMTAEDITQKANVAADTIIQNARNMSYQIMETTAKQVDSILKSINAQKNKLYSFREDYKSLISKYLMEPNDQDFVKTAEKIAALENYLNKFMEVDLESLTSEEDF